MISFSACSQKHTDTIHVGEAGRLEDPLPEQIAAKQNDHVVKPPSEIHDHWIRQPILRRQATESEPDPDLVTWDDKDDPASPHSE